MRDARFVSDGQLVPTLQRETAGGVAMSAVDHDRAERLHALLVAAAIETIPVDARVTDHREGGLWVVRVISHDVLVCGASHYDLATAITRCARALLAREGATGPACEELRREVQS